MEIIIIIVCLILILAIILHSKSLNEDKCVVKFKSSVGFKEDFIEREFKMSYLSEQLNKGVCPVKYTRYNGYQFNS